MKVYTTQDHQTRATMFARQVDQIQIHNHASKYFIQGLHDIQLSPTTIPGFDQLSQTLIHKTGWTVVSIGEEFLSNDQRFMHLSNKRFPSTDYIRTRQEIDFTPKPDLFHEIFGHLPVMTNPLIADIVYEFGQKYNTATDQQKEMIEKLYWFTIEYALLREDGKIKAFGAGLLSSPGDLQRIHENGFEIRAPSMKAIQSAFPSPDRPHTGLFLFNSPEEFRTLLEQV